MSIALLSATKASSATRSLYQSIQERIGRIPNVYKVYGHSAAALKSNLALEDLLGQGELSPVDVEIIALVVGEWNDCAYCLAAHTALGKQHGLTEEQITNIRRGSSTKGREQALIDFTRAILAAKGDVGAPAVAAFTQEGYSVGAVIEVVAQIAKNVFNNYTNRLAATPIDFPSATPR